jgi:esterase
MQLNFQSYGNGEPLIILHGLFGSLKNWDAISRKLAAHFRVLAVDQRNHGRSPHDSRMDYPTMAADVSELLDACQLPRAHVLGHSMGGKTAMTFALRYPQQCARLIVADIAPRAFPPHHAGILEALMGLDLDSLKTRKEIEEALAGAIPDLGLRRFLLMNLEQGVGGSFSWRMGLAEIHEAYESLGERVSGTLTSTGPALFLRGETSDYLLDDDLPQILSMFPQARLKTVRSAGHLLHVENPTEFLQAVADFLSDRPSAILRSPDSVRDPLLDS